MSKSKKLYVVFNGKYAGIYHSWFGEDGALRATHGVSGCQHKSYKSLEEAQAAMTAYRHDKTVL